MEAAPMKLVGIIGTAVLSLTLAAPVYAQQEQHEQQEDKDKPAEKKAQPERSAKQEEKTARPEERSAQQEKNAKPEQRNAKQDQRAPEAKPAKQDQHAGGRRIPDDRKKPNFGQRQTFRVNEGVYSNRHFQYGGYSYGFVGVWPSNWLYTQNVYVIDIDGVYYLCNPIYPGVNIELNVTL